MRFFVFLVCMFNFLAMSASFSDEKKTKELPEIVLGSPQATHEVILCFSPTCHHCAHYETEDFPEVEKKFVKTGKIKFIIRLLTINSLDYAIGKLCWSEGKERFVEFAKLFLSNQEEWFFPILEKNKEKKKKSLEEKLTTVAKKLEMDSESLRSKMNIDLEDDTAFLKLFCLKNDFSEKQILDALVENPETEKSLTSVLLKCLKEDGELLDYAPAFYIDGKLMDEWATVDVITKKLKLDNVPTQAKKLESEDLESQPSVHTKPEAKAEHKDGSPHQMQLGVAAAA